MLSVSCSTSVKIESGDLVFRGATQNDLSEAINEVTQTSKATNYSHIGLCDVVDDKVIVYHSDFDRGVVKESLEKFLNPNDSLTYNVDLYRIKNITKKQVIKAISIAKQLVGESYNTTYILEDEGYYCSEYIYELFKADSIFTLEPMTFINPETNDFHEGWISHYKELGIEIPQGKLGCNPNGMANSETILFLDNLK